MVSNNNNLLEAFSKKFACWLRHRWGWVCGVIGSGLVFQGLVAAASGVRGFGRSSDITLSGINRNGAASPTAILHSCVAKAYGGGNELGEVREGTQVHKNPSHGNPYEGLV